MQHLKYIALGILVGSLAPYIYQLTQKPDKGKGVDYSPENEE